MAEALRQIPADAIDKVEVITIHLLVMMQRWSWYLNIILKKVKSRINGTFIASTGYPETYGLSGNLNYKTAKMNFTTTGYNYRTNQGGGRTNSQYFADGSTPVSLMKHVIRRD
jgi:hypothetical protein